MTSVRTAASKSGRAVAGGVRGRVLACVTNVSGASARFLAFVVDAVVSETEVVAGVSTAAVTTVAAVAAGAGVVVVAHALCTQGLIGRALVTAVLAVGVCTMVRTRLRARSETTRSQINDARTAAAATRPARRAALAAALLAAAAANVAPGGHPWTCGPLRSIVADYAVGAALLLDEQAGLRVCDVDVSDAPEPPSRPAEARPVARFFATYYVLCPAPERSYRVDFHSVEPLRPSPAHRAHFGVPAAVVEAYSGVYACCGAERRAACPKCSTKPAPVWVAARWCCVLHLQPNRCVYALDTASGGFARLELPLPHGEWVVDALGALLLVSDATQRVLFALDLAEAYAPRTLPPQPHPANAWYWQHVTPAWQPVGTLSVGCVARFLPAPPPPAAASPRAYPGRDDGMDDTAAAAAAAPANARAAGSSRRTRRIWSPSRRTLTRPFSHRRVAPAPRKARVVAGDSP